MWVLRLGGVVFLLLVCLVLARPVAAAGNGSVSVAPAVSNVPQGDNVTVSVVGEPADSGVSIWIVRVAFDHSVLQFVSCTPMADPGGGIAQVSGCDIAGNGDFVTFGGWVENQGGLPHGFESTQTLGTVTFQAIGASGSHSDLDITVQSYLGPNGEMNQPETNDGVVNVVVPPVGGAVEVLTASSGGSAGPSVALLSLAAVGPLAVAFVMRRRIIGR